MGNASLATVPLGTLFLLKTECVTHGHPETLASVHSQKVEISH